ncbi:MAG TPA: hypothetical protein VFY15_02825 [Acidimicrobiia bacterium]|nr:hypothetical protein [Acidimicrobiia bacterium]
MRLPLTTLLALALVAPACGDGGGAPVPFTLTVTPEFVQGAVTGQPTGVLVTIENESATTEPVTISAIVAGASVTVSPAEITAGEVAEVWFTVDPGTSDGTPMVLAVTGTRGDETETATRSFSAFDWADDRGEYAGELFDLFRSWLGANHPDLGITADTEFEGSFVAPGLLVVSHYLYLSPDWEVGLSWHVMIPPDDWAEIYLRPRDEALPTLAFRLTSQAAAGDGEVVITAVPAPVEVTR